MWQMIRSLPIQDEMKVGHRWTSVLSVMAVLCVTLNADSKTCENEIKVRRHTTYEAVLGGQVTIACPVRFCNGSAPKITWFKMEEKFMEINLSDRFQTEWTRNNDEGTHFLTFNNVQSSDLGLYRCRLDL
ncbi:hypothetical protein NL108_002607 [Boleophthalmus pectinirostris]|nr:hypothetical protein NL108_002607 [Boleophthalmus pectinirostris]